METDASVHRPSLRKGDWVRFQIRANKIVLEGFIQEISADESKVRIGKAPLSPENAWYALGDISILRLQVR